MRHLRDGGRRFADIALLIAPFVAAGLMLGACSSDSATKGSSSLPFGDKISALFGSNQQPDAPAGGTPVATGGVECPPVDIRQGASTLIINAAKGDGGAMALQYQGTLVRAARECRLAPPNAIIKVGIEGRIILGPAGGSGRIMVPLRYALVQESVTSSKPLWTKLYIFPVEIPPQSESVNFTHIEEDMVVPIPRAGTDLTDYLIYIGFDPDGAAQEAKKPVKPAPKPKAPPRTQ